MFDRRSCRRDRQRLGTHFDAPIHWVTGKDGADVSQVPVSRLIAPAVVLDFAAEAAKEPDFLLEIDYVRQWEAEHGELPAGGWLLFRTGCPREPAPDRDVRRP